MLALKHTIFVLSRGLEDVESGELGGGGAEANFVG